MRRLVIVTGLSGAGKSQAMKSFEDLGFACLDNVPPVLAVPYVALVAGSSRDRAALAFDVRSGGSFGDPLEVLDVLGADEANTELLFLDADDETLVRRYSETRRRHPLCDRTATVVDAIAAERAALAALRDRADHLWDTSHLTHGMLKERIARTFGDEDDERTHVSVVAFGFKFGVPLDADFVFDVRFLPNPHYVPALQPHTGNDPDVRAFIEAAPDLAPFLQRMFALVDFVTPRTRVEGKSQLTFAVGCTGGRHRSVYVAHRLAEHLAASGTTVAAVVERDIRR
jgi:RNase adapter protein RapZ